MKVGRTEGEDEEEGRGNISKLYSSLNPRSDTESHGWPLLAGAYDNIKRALQGIRPLVHSHTHHIFLRRNDTEQFMIYGSQSS